jgi:capsular polysaccharide biosynthesis protein
MSLLGTIVDRLRRGSAPSAQALHRRLAETIRRGERQAALALCDEILARWPDDARALLGAAVIRLKDGQPERAVSHFARIDELESGGVRSARLVRESLMDPERAARSEPYVAVLDEVLVDTGYWSVIDGERIFTREIQARTVANSPLVRGRVSRDGQQCVVSLPRAPLRVDEPCVLLGSDYNYAHWVLRNLLKLSLLEGADVPAGTRCLVREDLRRWQCEYLELIGIPEERLLRVPDASVVACRRLYVPTQLRNHPRMGEGMAWLRARVAPLLAAPSQANDLVYASRREQSKRRLLNEAQVEAALAALGFRIIVPGEMSVREQIEAFSRARVVVAPHGAGLANMVFAPPGAALLEILSSAILHMDEFRYLCKAAGMRTRSVVSQDMEAAPAVAEGPEMHRDYRVDVGEVLSAVGELLASLSAR